MPWQKDPDGNDIWVPGPGESATPPKRNPFNNPIRGEMPIVTWFKNYFSEDERLKRSGVNDPLERQRIIAERAPKPSAPAVTQTETVTSSPNWFMLSGMNPFYGPNVSENDRTQILNLLGKPPAEGGVGAVYVGGNGPTAQYRVGNITLSENDLLNQYFSKGINTKTAYGTTGTGGTPAYVSAAQAENYLASAELARAQAANIPVQQQLERDKQIAAEAARKFGQGAQLVGLQTGNQDLANRGSQIVFDQSNAVAQAQNRILELGITQDNLRAKSKYDTDMANAAAGNAAQQFNITTGLTVDQLNEAAARQKQQDMQALARDIAEAAKAPGDYGKLAALTLANAGWGAPNTAIGKGEDLRTAQSMAPLESQLRTRQDVMARPDRPYTFTPYTPTMVQAPVIAPIDVSKFAMPQQTMTMADVNRQKREGLAAIAGLGSSSGAMSPGAYMSNLASQLQSGVSSADVNAQLNQAIANQIASLPGPQGESGGVPAAAEGGIVPRYEDGGVNNSSEFNPIAVYQMLRSGGASEQQAADFINTILRSDQALASNTAAKAASDADSAARAAQPVYRPAPQRMTDASNDTEAQLLRLGMEQQYQQPIDIEQVATQMPPAMYSPASGGYYATEDAAPAAVGWTPQFGVGAAPAPKVSIPGLMPEDEEMAADYNRFIRGDMPTEEYEKKWVTGRQDEHNAALSRISSAASKYEIPAAGSAVLAAAASMPWFMRWIAKGAQYTPQAPLKQPAAPSWSEYPGYVETLSPQNYQYRFRVPQAPLTEQPGYGRSWRFSPMDLENAASAMSGKNTSLYATGGIAPGAYISGERGPELNIPLGDKTIVLNQKQMKAAGIDLKKLMSGSKKPEQFADGGIFDAGWGNVQDQDRTMSMQFLNDALARARAGTPFQEGALPAPVYASTPGFSPLVTQVLGSLTSMAQGVPTEYFQELAAKYRPSGIRESVTQRSA
jgi:hypothetical protein